MCSVTHRLTIFSSTTTPFPKCVLMTDFEQFWVFLQTSDVWMCVYISVHLLFCCNQSILKEIRPGISLEGMMLKLKLQSFGHFMRRVDSMEKTLSWEGLGAGGEGDDWGWDGWMASLTRWTWIWVNSGSWWWTGRPGVLRFMGSQRVRHNWVTELTN